MSLQDDEADGVSGSGFDREALQRLSDAVEREIDEGRLPAAQYAFARGDRVEIVESFGSATDTTPFNVFSCTKALIAGAAWLLIGEGKLSATTRAVELIDDFGARGRTPAWMAEVTLEHLLTHTSGFPTAPLGPPRWAARASRLEVMQRWHATTEPGSHFQYHPTSAHWVIAEMIASATGRDHRDVVNEQIIGPLGLSELRFGEASADAGVAELVAVGSPATADEVRSMMSAAGVDGIDLIGEELALEEILGEVTPEVLLAFNDPSVRALGVPGAGATSTAAGLSLYYQALLHNTGGLWQPDVLSDATGTVRCTMPDPITGVPANRSLGLVIAGDDGLSRFRGMGPTVSPRTFGHNGAGGQIAWADPTTGVSFVFLTSGIERNILREARRILSISAKSGLCLPAPR